MKKFLITSLLLSLSLFAGCGGKSNPLPDTPKEPLTLGWIGPLSGDRAELGQQSLKATELAIADINAAGGLDGQTIQLISEDGKCSSKEANLAAHKLINLYRVPVLFAVCSPEVLSAAPLAEEQGAVLIGLQSSAAPITEAGDYIFRTHPASIVQGTFAADAAYHILGKHKAAVLVEESDWGHGLSDRFQERFKGLNGEIVAAATYQPFATDFTKQLQEMKDSGAELVFFPTAAEAAPLALQQAKEIGLSISILGSDTWSEANLTTLPFAEGIYYAAPKVATTGRIAAHLENNHLPVTRATTTAYDTTHMIIELIRHTGPTPDTIKTALYTMPVYEGSNGPISFDTKGDLESPSFDLFQIQKGTAVLQ